MDPATLVTTFKALPRNPKVPSGFTANHWHFSLRHVPLNPPGTLLFLINPGSRYIHVEGPIPPAAENEPLPLRATIYAMLLLKAFNNNLGAPLEHGKTLRNGRPWSWSTDDAEVAGAVGEVLRGWGVGEGLESVGIAGQEDNTIATEQWAQFLEGLKSKAGVR
ncbi:MAG: hypothetical protein HETSPECPRED_009611 [Heterodermia speciosa]|uniref:Uncharacterized protein n=1 Tax=Heterodermia speciosa TaxID=116794 RepID=A0A8H3IDY4_9LECA|nr:MAG: hypothetical protein HETSPECPRED_009611 [Heterodermia speciosa]